jgi:HSP20 family protein
VVEAVTKVPVKIGAKSVPSATAVASWAPFDTLRREVDRLFESVATNPWGMPLARTTFPFEMPWPRPMGSAVSPAVDISEKDKEFEISAELPGMSEKDIELKLSNRNFMIKGEKREEREEHEKDYHLSERRYGSFVRSLAVLEGVDFDKIEAAFANDLLKVKLPKSAQAKASEKRIEENANAA